MGELEDKSDQLDKQHDPKLRFGLEFGCKYSPRVLGSVNRTI